MPIYTYECSRCNDVFETTQGINDKPLKRHKDCGGNLQRIISNTSFVLKGSGWFKDGYSKGDVQ